MVSLSHHMLIGGCNEGDIELGPTMKEKPRDAAASSHHPFNFYFISLAVFVCRRNENAGCNNFIHILYSNRDIIIQTITPTWQHRAHKMLIVARKYLHKNMG